LSHFGVNTHYHHINSFFIKKNKIIYFIKKLLRHHHRFFLFHMGFTINFGQKESKLKNYKTSKLKVSENENISAEKAYILKELKTTQILDVIQTLYLAYYWNGKKNIKIEKINHIF